MSHRPSISGVPSSLSHRALLLNRASTMPAVHLLDYVAGNVRSLVNAIEKVGYTVEWIKSPSDVPFAEVREHSHPRSPSRTQPLTHAR